MIETKSEILCADCEKELKEEEYYNNNGQAVCESCSENYFVCEDCSESYNQGDSYSCEHIDNLYCENCWDGCRDCDDNNDNEKVNTRAVCEKLPNIKNFKKGEIITSSRAISFEVECYYSSVETMNDIADEISRTIGITYDGSLNNNGIELQTPPMTGENAETLVRNLCDKLNDADCKVDNTCGLHLHLDDHNSNDKTKQAIWVFYLVFEDVILSFLPKSRRNNRFCYPLKKDFHLDEIMKADNINALEMIWYRESDIKQKDKRKADKYDTSRYHGVNLHSLLANGHLEIRYHSGTLNANKMLFWANLHQTICDNALEILSETLLSNNLLTLTEKTEKFFELLNLSEKVEKYFTERQSRFYSAEVEAEKILCAV